MRLRHRHVLVDEYQDVNRASVRLVKALAGDGKRLWVVGDARQSIYRFRGASSVNMAAFKSDYPSAVADRLDINYRSTQQVIDAFTAFAPRNGRIRRDAAAGAGCRPRERAGAPRSPAFRHAIEEKPRGSPQLFASWKTQGVPLRDQAVLCRSNGRLNEIAAALEARSIPVLHLGSLFERDEIRDLLSLLSLAVDPFGDALVRVGALPRYDVPLQDVRPRASALAR